MALQRRGGRGGGHSATIWPGFVDAMTGLLLVLMFVLTIFTVVQFVLRDEISGQQDQLTELTSEVASLTAALGLERDRTASLETDLSDASDLSSAQAALIATLTAERDQTAAALADAETRITGFEAQVAGLLAERGDLRDQVAGLEQTRADLLTEQEALNLALASARTEIDAAAEAARLAAARREAMETLVARLQNDSATQGETINALEAERLLDAAAAEALRAELADADAELTAMTLALEEQRRQAEETLTLLAAAESARDDLDVRLAATILARDRAEADLAAALGDAADLDARLLAALSLQEVTEADLAAARAALDTAAAERDNLAATLDATRADREARLAAAEAAQADLETRLAAALAAQELAAGDMEAARQAIESALAAAEADRATLQDRLTQALLAQSALRAEMAARAALDNPDEVADLESQLAAALAARDAAIADRRNAEAAADDLSARLAATLDGANDEIVDTLTRQAEDLRAELAAALAARDRAETDRTLALSETDRQAALLAAAQGALSEQEALSAESQRQVAALNEQVAALRAEVGQLQSLLDLAETADVEAQVQIEALGAQLNTALARVAAEERRRAELEEAERLRLQAETERLAREAADLAAEAQDLERYRSDFFGRLRDVVDGQEGIRIEGDRFVFSSEVLFDPGRAELAPEGQAELAAVGALLRTIKAEIPPGIDWVIRVDGHTDNVPLSGQGEFADNWELSQARALSVVRYLIDNEDIPPERLAANGFGEFQPVTTEDTDAARALNRRIELKLTER
jgi:chemotaxis protein MotB